MPGVTQWFFRAQVAKQSGYDVELRVKGTQGMNMNRAYLKRYYTILSWLLAILVIVGLQGKVALGGALDATVSETKENQVETEKLEIADQSTETEEPASGAIQSMETEEPESLAVLSMETEEPESNVTQPEESGVAGENAFFWYDPGRTILLMEAPGIVIDTELPTQSIMESPEALELAAAESPEALELAAAESPEASESAAANPSEVSTPFTEEEEPRPNHVQAEDPAKDEQETPVPDLEETSFLEVCYLDIGQGDAILILCDGHSMLIDGGSPSRSDTIYAVLKKRGITHLDYIVSSHPDNDHLGGLPAALSYTKAGVALSPVTQDDRDRFHIF